MIMFLLSDQNLVDNTIQEFETIVANEIVVDMQGCPEPLIK
jgi:hypothetical protein